MAAVWMGDSNVQRRLAQAAVSTALVVFAVVTFFATKVEPLPEAAVPPVHDLRENTSPKKTRVAAAEIEDPFRLIVATDTTAADLATVQTPQDHWKLTGTAALGDGGIAIVEAGPSSRILRVGDEWEGMRLRKVESGEATFVDLSSGEAKTLRIRKADRL